MSRRAGFAFRVEDLAASVAFYTERVGFALDEQQPDDPGVVKLVDSDGDADGAGEAGADVRG
jgi:catechol 2,3-dioxygenase-like lactoylglutathione lyase family enzyme